MEHFLTSSAFWGLTAVALAAFILARIVASRDPRRAQQKARRAKVRNHVAEQNLARLSEAARRTLSELVAHKRRSEAIKFCRAELNIAHSEGRDVIRRLEQLEMDSQPQAEG